MSERLAIAAKATDGGIQGLASAIGVHRNTISRWISGKTDPNSKQLELVANASGKDLHWLLTGKEDGEDSHRGNQAGSKHGNTRRFRADELIPIYGTAAGALAGSISITSEVVEWTTRPIGLENITEAYALIVVGQSMVPRFFPDDVIFVNPNKAPHKGDVVIIQTQNHDGDAIVSYIKELVRSTNQKLIVCQYKPEATISYENFTVKSVHRVMTMNELLNL